MNAESLLVSAGINIGLVLVILCLFSIFRKQPSNANIYYARRLSLNQHILFDRSFSLRRFLPSVDWIRDALHVTEDEILDSRGLDALIIIRLFKFGINFFVVCSIIGLLILLPLNYTCSYGFSTSSRSMDSFTISNITKGSDRLWVHFSCLCFISFYGLYQLHKEYHGVLLKRSQQLRNLRHQPNQFTVLVQEIPVCDEHKAYGCCVDHFFSKYHPHAYQSYQILYDEKDHENLLELPVAFVTFRSRWGAALAAQTQQHSNPLLWITEMAPEPRDVIWKNLGIPYRHLALYNSGVLVAGFLFTIFFAIPVTAVQGIAQFEKLRKWFPPAMAVQLIPGLRSIVTGYLPSVILSGFVYIVPFAMDAMARAAGYVSRSKKDRKACSMVFYFLMGNVFFLSLLSGSLLNQIGKSFIHPGDVPSRLASAVSAQADFFMTYILTSGLCGFSLEILQPGLLLWDTIKCHTWGRRKKKVTYLYSFPYSRVIPSIALFLLIGVVYTVVAPLLLPFLIGYFLLGYVVFIHQIQDVYEITYETCGQYWPHIHNYILVAIIMMQITMIGLFGLKAKPSASTATVPLLILTIAFNEYCKIRFRPTFYNCSVQDAKENDELDENNGLEDANYYNALDAYRPPRFRSVIIATEDSSSMQPLVSST